MNDLNTKKEVVKVEGRLKEIVTIKGRTGNCNHHSGRSMGCKGEFFKRAVATYIISSLVVGMLLTLIQRAPWAADPILAFKRAVVAAFPSSMSAAAADTIK